MKTYLPYALISLLIVWVYIVFQSLKNQREVQKETGVNLSLVPLKLFFGDRNDVELAAYKKLRRKGRRLVRIWIISIFIFLIVTILVLALTTKGG